jgi:hypothetical protein
VLPPKRVVSSPSLVAAGRCFWRVAGFGRGVSVICACSRKLSVAADDAFFCREQELAATRFARIVSSQNETTEAYKSLICKEEITIMQAYHTTSKVTPNGGLVITGLPFHSGVEVEVTVEAKKTTRGQIFSTPLDGFRIEKKEPAEPSEIWDELKEFDGMADDLPADLAANLDHYIHGHPRL